MLTTPGVANVWLITVLVGIAYGAACAARGKVIPLLARQAAVSSTYASGVINAVMVIGLLAGTVVGMGLFALVKHPGANHWWPHILIGVVMLGVAVAGWRMRVPEPRPIPFRRGARDLLAGSGAMLLRHWAPLTGGGIAWGVASAASISMLMFLINELHIGETTAATIGAFSAIGAILGNLLSHRFAHRWQVGASYALMCAIIFAFPYAVTGYGSAAVLAVLSGVAFAGGSNVLDAQFMADAHREGQAGRGATIMSPDPLALHLHHRCRSRALPVPGLDQRPRAVLAARRFRRHRAARRPVHAAGCADDAAVSPLTRAGRGRTPSGARRIPLP